MPKAETTGDATALIDKYIEGLSDWRAETLATIRKAFHDADPEVLEEWKWMGSPVFSHAGHLAVADAHKAKVKVTFSQGAHLPDPRKLFNNGLGGKQWRAIDLYQDDTIDEAALRDLIRAAVSYNVDRKK